MVSHDNLYSFTSLSNFSVEILLNMYFIFSGSACFLPYFVQDLLFYVSMQLDTFDIVTLSAMTMLLNTVSYFIIVHSRIRMTYCGYIS